MIKHGSRTAVIFLVVLCLQTTAVYAAWNYSTDMAGGMDNAIVVGIAKFEYKPEEVLPGDQQSTQLHENHFNLVTNIVNHNDYGLNATKKPIVRKLLENGAGVVYSNQSVSGGNLKHMLLGGSDVEALMFVVQYVSDTEYVSYTFSGESVDSEHVGQYVSVYKTVMEKKGAKWEATVSYKGKAKVFRPGIVDYSIDVTTWENA